MIFSYQSILDQLAQLNSSLQYISGDYYNAVFSIPIESELILDEVTGNYTTSLATTKDYQVKLLKKSLPSPSNVTIEELAGVDISNIFYEGRFLEKFVDRLPTKVKTILYNNNIAYQGYFYFTFSPVTPLLENIDIASSLGTQFTGALIIND